VWPVERRVIEMPRAVNDGPRPRLAQSPASRAPVVGIRLESQRTSRVGRVIVGGVALGVAGCVLAISLFRGGVIATRAFYSPMLRMDLPFTPDDDYASVVRAFGPPAAQRRHTVTWGSANEQFELLAYPQRRLYFILMDSNAGGARYVGALDWNWRPAHAVDLPGRGSSYGILRRLPKF